MITHYLMHAGSTSTGARPVAKRARIAFEDDANHDSHTAAIPSSLQSTQWSRGDAGAPSGHSGTSARGGAKAAPRAAQAAVPELDEFAEKMMQEIEADEMNMDRDWYLREEEGGLDDEGDAFGGDEDSFRKPGVGAAPKQVRTRAQ